MRLASIVGMMLIGWCAFEFVLLPNPAAAFYAVVGVAQGAMSLMLLRQA
jgi:hypothetical protein